MRSRQVSKISNLVISDTVPGRKLTAEKGIGGWLGRGGGGVHIRCGYHGNIDGWGLEETLLWALCK